MAASDQSNTIGELLDRFLEQHVRRNLKVSTANEMARIINRDIRPNWGSRKVETISKRDVIALLEEITERGADTLANRVLALVRKFFSWLVSRAVIDVSPVAGVKALSPEVSRDRVLTDNEIRWLWEATDSREPFSSAIRLLLLTGQRRSEVGELRWSELELEREEWTLPRERTKNGRAHTVPLAPMSVSILREVHQIDQSEYVFTTTGRTAISGWSKYKARVDATMAIIAASEEAVFTPWRIHDLRRTCASGMARLNHSVHVVEKLLNHVSGTYGGIVGVYQRYEYADEKRRAAAAWASHVQTLVSGQSSNVVRLVEASK